MVFSTLQPMNRLESICESVSPLELAAATSVVAAANKKDICDIRGDHLLECNLAIDEDDQGE